MPRELAHERAREDRIVGKQSVEAPGLEREQLAVSDGFDGGRPGGSRQQRELAERIAGPELAHDPRAVVCLDEDAEPPRPHDEEPIGRVTAAEQVFASAKRDRAGVPGEPLERLPADAAEERGA